MILKSAGPIANATWLMRRWKKHYIDLPVLANLNRETLTHSADNLNLMFRDSDQSCRNSNPVLDFKAFISIS